MHGDRVVLSPEGDLERLYREEADRLWRALFAFTGDRDVASDAAAEAFAQILGRWNAVHSPRPWVWRAAFRIAAGELKERRRPRATLTQLAYEMPDPADDLISALARLSPKQRASVLLHHYAGYSVEEVATMLGSTRAAVRVHLHRGRNRLRELLGGRDD